MACIRHQLFLPDSEDNGKKKSLQKYDRGKECFLICLFNVVIWRKNVLYEGTQCDSYR